MADHHDYTHDPFNDHATILILMAKLLWKVKSGKRLCASCFWKKGP